MDSRLLVLLFIAAVSGRYGEGPCDKEMREGFEFIGDNPGIAGIFIPSCEKNGDYKPVQCPQDNCHCVTREGKVIEGYELPWPEVRRREREENDEMNCICARDQYEYEQKGLIGLMFHCNDLGNYHKVQCRGSVCFCVDLHGNQVANGATAPIQDKHTLNC